SVGARESAVEIVFVGTPVECIGAALGHQLHLASAATVKVCGLICRGNLELLDTGDGNRDHSRGRLGETRAVLHARSTSGIAAEAGDVRVVIPAHVVGGIAAVELERVLVGSSAARVAVDVLAGLEDSQRRSIAGEVGQVN